MIQVREVRLRAPGPAGVEILAGLDLNIRANECMVLNGPNGAGKSLFLQVLAGLRKPTSGVIQYVSSNLSVALVFQSPDDQIVGSTVERDLAFGLENQGLPPRDIRRRVDEALEWSGLAPQARTAPHLLSEGEKQRLALTSAIILRPAVMLLDEPTSRLDPAARRLFLDAVRRVRMQAGTTVVHVTHRSEEVMEADRVVGMEAGKIVFDGTPAGLLASEHADALGILWSPHHRLRRALRERGVPAAGEPGAGWNDLGALIAEVSP